MRKSAGERQRESGLDGHPVDGGDGELVESTYGGVDALRDGAQAVVGADCAVVAVTDLGDQGFTGDLGAVALQVVAGAEGAGPNR